MTRARWIRFAPVINVTPLRVEYGLTPLGASLAALLLHMGAARAHMEHVQRNRERYAGRGSERGRLETERAEHGSRSSEGAATDDGSPHPE